MAINLLFYEVIKDFSINDNFFPLSKICNKNCSGCNKNCSGCNFFFEKPRILGAYSVFCILFFSRVMGGIAETTPTLSHFLKSRKNNLKNH